MAYEISVINENTWTVLNAGFVRVFILEGESETLVVDTGADFPELIDVVKQLSKKPLKLILTHADMDHCNGTRYFESFYMSSSEAAHYYKHTKLGGEYIPVENGEIIDIGGRPVEIISLPGHTAGSIGLLDINGRVLFGGDVIQDGEIFMFGDHRDLNAYCHSLKKLENCKSRFDLIYASHGTLVLEPDMISKLYNAAKGVMAGEYTGTDSELFGHLITIFDTGCAKFLVDRK